MDSLIRSPLLVVSCVLTDLTSSRRRRAAVELQLVLSRDIWVHLITAAMVFEKKMLTYGDPDDEVRQVTVILLALLLFGQLLAKTDLTSGESPVSTGSIVGRCSVSALFGIYHL